MSREKRERINLGLTAGLVSASVALAALGCSSSDAGKASVSGCDPAVSAECAPVGGACTSDGGCESGSCSAGACVAGDVSGNGGAGSSTGNGTGGTFILTDDFEPAQGGSGPAVCVDLEVDFERVTPTVVLLIDRSGSMTQNFDNGVDRWDTLVNTLTDPESSLVKKLESSVRFGMSLYTSEGGFGGGDEPKECPILTSVDIGLDNFSAISSVLKVEANGPRGDTPTAESMELVAAELTAFGEDGPKAIILATDGDPDTCEDPMANDDQASKDLSVGAVEAAYEAGIPTHVISVGNQVTASHLKALAEAGAGGDPSAEAYTALDTAALVNAFNQIIGSVRTCDFTLAGTVKAGSASLGTVVLDGAPLVFGSADGWEMPDESTVRLLGQACETVQEDASAISMTFPCDVIQIIPR